MAVVFVSPKKRQATALTAVVTLFLLFAGLIILWTFFFSAPSADQIQITFNPPKVTVNTVVMDSPQFKALQTFSAMPLQFGYTAQYNSGKNKGKAVAGNISAASEGEARKLLEATGLTVGKLVQIVPGRDNPFVPYIGSINTTKP